MYMWLCLCVCEVVCVCVCEGGGVWKFGCVLDCTVMPFNPLVLNQLVPGALSLNPLVTKAQN